VTTNQRWFNKDKSTVSRMTLHVEDFLRITSMAALARVDSSIGSNHAWSGCSRLPLTFLSWDVIIQAVIAEVRSGA